LALLFSLSLSISSSVRAEDIKDVFDEGFEASLHRNHAQKIKPSAFNKQMNHIMLNMIDDWNPDGQFTLPSYLKFKETNRKVWERETREIYLGNVIQENLWQFSAKCCADMKEMDEVSYGEKMHFFRITVNKNSRAANDVLLQNTLMHRIGTASKCLFGFWARSPQSIQMHVTYELTNAPYTNVFNHTANLNKEWQYFACKQDFPANKSGEYSVRFQLGTWPGTIDIRTNIHLRVNTSDSFTNAQRIDAHRTGKLNILVQDNESKPVKKAFVSLNLTKNAFLFGSDLYHFSPTDKSTLAKNIGNNFKALFNAGSVPIFWSTIEPVEGKPDYSHTLELINWCKANNITPVARTLLDSAFYPSWAPADPAKSGAVIKAHVANLIGRIGDSFEIIELANDLITSVNNTKLNGEDYWIRSMPTTINQRYGPPAVALQRLLVMAREANHNKKTKFIWCCDDQAVLDDFLEYKLSFGSMPDAIVLLAQIHSRFHPSTTDDAIGKLEHYHIPIYLYAYSPAVLRANPENPLFDRTSTILEVYRLAFSHRNTAGIIWDGLLDEPHNPRSYFGLLNSDGTPKPIYNALANLINKKWSTRAAGTTDDTGIFSTKAFFGEYLISIKLANGKTITKKVNFEKNAQRSQTITVHI
jgi:hypothetical protein